MDNSLLNDNFTDSIDITKISKSITLGKTVIILGSVNYILDLGRWVRLLLKFETVFLSRNYYYLIHFFCIAIPLAVLFFVSWLLYLKANKSIQLSVAFNDPHYFNKAFNLINKSITLSIIGTCISLLGILISLISG